MDEILELSVIVRIGGDAIPVVMVDDTAPEEIEVGSVSEMMVLPIASEVLEDSPGNPLKVVTWPSAAVSTPLTRFPEPPSSSRKSPGLSDQLQYM